MIRLKIHDAIELSIAKMLLGGYKGFGIELMIELLCDACLGTPSGKRKLMAGLDPTVDNGLYLAFDPIFLSSVTYLMPRSPN